MRQYIKRLVTVCMIIMLAANSCTIEERGGTDNGTNELLFSYTLPGSMSIQTYAVAAENHENRIYDLYVLFFDPSDNNQYIGCARSGVSTTSTTGSSRVSMPEGYDVTDPWKLLFVANLEEYLLDSVTDPAAWLDSQLTGRDCDYAAAELMGMSTAAIRSPLLMSGEADKAGNTNEVSVELARRVARIDVVNSASNFTLVSAQVWNARTYAYLFEDGGIPAGASANSFSNYEDNVAAPVNGNIQAKLYAFPNTSIPTEGDINTTCLIIGGIYTGSGGSGSITYYRVNVCANQALQQTLNGNSIYTIDITNVSGDGDGSPGDAHNKDNLQITYSLNNWDDTYSILYVFDKDGNALGVSQRFVNFSYRGPQKADIQVFRLYSDTNPLTGDWAVDAPTGSYASVFTVTKQAGTHVTVEVIDENTLVVDRGATARLTWGTIELPLVLTQLSQSSQLESALVSPTTLSFPLLNAEPKEVCINLQGNYTGVTRSDIETAFVYSDSSDTGWLYLSPGSTPDNPDMGLFYFNIQPLDYNVDGGVRYAELKFVIRQGDRLTTAQVDIYQSPDSFSDGELRIVEIVCMEYDDDLQEYINRGSTASLSAKVPGLPFGQTAANHVHFRMVGHEYIKYVMTINSSLDWRIVATGVTAQGLNFSQMSGTGNFANAVDVEITTVSDVDWGWDGVFYVEYEDGATTAIVVHQTGIMASNTAGAMYYYGLMRLNKKLWLDRNVGATAPMDHDDPTVGYFNSTNPLYNTNTAARGGFYAYSARNTQCPAGFRQGRYATDGSVGEWDYIYNNIVWTGTSATNTSEHPDNVWYLAYGSADNPRYWYLPIAGTGAGYIGSNVNVAYFWMDNVSAASSLYNGGSYQYYIQLNASSGARSASGYTALSSSGNQYSIRCVYDSDHEFPDEP